jgi:hypothetical protein
MPKRIPNDAYYTPLPIYKWLQDKLQLTNQRIFDPCCGNSHATALTFGKDNHVVENDIVPPTENNNRYCFDATEGWDQYLEAQDFYGESEDGIDWAIDWVITNPPYKRGMSEAIIEQSLIHASTGVAMLLRLSWLEPTRNRVKLLTNSSPRMTLLAVYPVSPRPKFDPNQNGNDSVTVAWFIWGNCTLELQPFDFCVGWQK